MHLNTTRFLRCITLTAALGLTGCPGGGNDTDDGTTAGSTAGSATDNPTSSTGDNSAGSSGGGSSGGGAAPDCMTYCDTIMANCTAANAQYSSMESCMGACAAFPVGVTGETSGNTLGCRTYHSGAAATDAATHCVHAGPGGAGACGSNCEGFCSIAVATCPTEHPDEATCMTTCMGYMDTEPFDASDAAGNTLACRLYHASVAATDATAATTHCPHTTPDSPPCM